MDKEKLKSRLRDHEYGWVERKTQNIQSDEILEALVGFANSVPKGEKGLLFIGVGDDGSLLDVDNTDKLQKKIHRLAEWCYPPVIYQCQVVEENNIHVVAVIIEASLEKPHFAGPAYIRVGSQFQKASPRLFRELIARTNNMVDAILNERDNNREVYIEDKTRHGMPRTLCKVVDCNPHFATFQTVAAADDIRTAPVDKIYMTMNQGLAMFSIEP
ncbi:MAG TPA: ATP-binding protein [Pyrinomonadaceae bacterium]|jgi:predicted HTH transcriptional regulator|nr:ATP-binding protein [Pyrinomonadaceae bacterium]